MRLFELSIYPFPVSYFGRAQSRPVEGRRQRTCITEFVPKPEQVPCAHFPFIFRADRARFFCLKSVLDAKPLPLARSVPT